ncbi:contact-dependent growth inhibition system immunity protein [Streptomyces sp. NPDC048411]|uniref:contact-dependent growth inhibition system immunity protein n=1 Tax=Streptomyces sp. NPDC048411 TaxID=3157206 RepID=UPI0034558DD7
MTRPLNRDRSLEELEDDRRPAPSADATRLVATAHALRRKPIGELTVEGMRLLIRQNEGLLYLLPPALEVPRRDPMAAQLSGKRRTPPRNDLGGVDGQAQKMSFQLSM